MLEVEKILFVFFIALLAYLLGSIPTAHWVVRSLARKNVMEVGTGNVGMMNTYRATKSVRLSALVLIGDMGKGAVAVLAARYLAPAFSFDTTIAQYIAGIGAVLGHNYSIFLRFKGGKGIATSGAILLLVEPLAFPVWILVFFITVLFTRLFVLGQILGTVAVPIASWLLFPRHVIFLSILALIVFIKHAPRIRNIIDGTEPKMYYKIRPPAEGKP